MLSHIRIQWRLSLAIVIRCSKLRLWAGYFIYIKFTSVFFQWMFLNSFEKINMLRKEINRLLSKWNVKYLLKTYYWEKLTLSKLSKFKKFVIRSVFEKLQLMQISLNIKHYCCNFKISVLGAKLCVAFLLF